MHVSAFTIFILLICVWSYLHKICGAHEGGEDENPGLAGLDTARHKLLPCASPTMETNKGKKPPAAFLNLSVRKMDRKKL